MPQLVLIEDAEEKRRCQKMFARLLRNSWRRKERRVIVWRPSSAEMDIVHQGVIWYTTNEPERQQKTPRFWNAFGRYQVSGNLRIAVEINIPSASNSRRVSGFWAKDVRTGAVFLMHDGGIGGGSPGVGRDAFLAWISAKLIPVVDSQGVSREGVIVTALNSPTIGHNVATYAANASAFREARRRKDSKLLPTKKDIQTYNNYSPENSGRRRGRRSAEFDYISRHGEIVDALMLWRVANGGKDLPRKSIVKNKLIDLGVLDRNKLVELYEVKSSADRQSIYTAIGQILVHSCGNKGVKRFMVLPCQDVLSKGIARALEGLGIRVLRFKLSGEKVEIC